VVGIFVWPAANIVTGRPPSPTLFSGRAIVVQATVLGTNIVVSDTGELSSTGGEQDVSLLTLANLLPAPNSLTAEVLSASTMGSGNESTSKASTANVALTIAGNTITADVLMARANANCVHRRAFVSGRSDITTLVIDGQAITVTGQPNQMVNLSVGRVVINEQDTSTPGKITVNALHVIIPAVADVVISHAEADITCGKPLCPAADFATGGGFVTGTPSGAKGNFGLVGGFKPNGALSGHMTFIDHGPNGPMVNGTSVMNYIIIDATTREITYACEINHASGHTCVVRAADNGEPGVNDTFTITLDTGYSASGNLAGGNIQLHHPTCPH
jgi:hypothetical protein